MKKTIPHLPTHHNLQAWDTADRPREKFAQQGANTLSKAELLAILVGSGSREENVVELMQRILNDNENSLSLVGKLSVAQLCRYKGIGSAKAITILAACELGHRRASEVHVRQRFDCAETIFRFYHPRLADKAEEEVHLLCLNQHLGLIRSVFIGRGGLTSTSVDVRVILREALVNNALHLVLCHNHPSGNPKPSLADDKVTAQLHKACELMQLKLIDHIIVADASYYSYADEGKL